MGVQDGGGKYALYWNTKLLRSYRKIATNGSFYYKGNADRPTYTTTCKGRGKKKDGDLIIMVVFRNLKKIVRNAFGDLEG